MKTRSSWWYSVALTMIGAMSLSIGLVTIIGRSLSATEWLIALFTVGVGSLAWRAGGTEPATADDLALLTTNPAVAKTLAREHHARRLLTQGVLLGLGTAVLFAALLVAT